MAAIEPTEGQRDALRPPAEPGAHLPTPAEHMAVWH
jgi:hypothetical protein